MEPEQPGREVLGDPKRHEGRTRVQRVHDRQLHDLRVLYHAYTCGHKTDPSVREGGTGERAGRAGGGAVTTGAALMTPIPAGTKRTRQ